MEENNIIDVSKIKVISSDPEIPVHNNPILTLRPLCADFPENSLILDKTEAIKVITDISEDLEESKDTCINNIPQCIEDLQAVFNPLNVEECTSDLFKDKEYTLIDNIDDLKKYLSELLMRFDTSPGNYLKGDYLYLLTILYKSLIHLYEVSTASVIVNEWQNPHREDLVPSEKLVKETLDSEVNRLERLISDESSHIDIIESLIPELASSNNLLADKNYVNDGIATNSATFRGTYNSVQELEQVTADNNDYAFVISTDSTGNTLYNRYKYNDTEWLFEYALNNSSFTLAQWDTINSGVTASDKLKWNGYLPLILAAL